MSDQNEVPKINLPGNRKEVEKSPKPVKETKDIQPVVHGVATKRKKSLGSKFKDSFLGDDTKSVGGYIVHDVLIPSLKNLINEMVGGGIETLLFGSRRGSNITRSGGRSYYAYNQISSQRTNTFPANDNRAREISRTTRATHEFGDVDFTTRADAEMVLSELVDLTIDYGVVSVADFYTLAGIAPDFTDDKWGWEDLTGADVVQARGRRAYIIRLPRPIQIT